MKSNRNSTKDKNKDAKLMERETKDAATAIKPKYNSTLEITKKNKTTVLPKKKVDKIDKDSASNLKNIKEKYKLLRKQATSFKSENAYAKPQLEKTTKVYKKNSSNNVQNIQNVQKVQQKVQNFKSTIPKSFNINMFDKINAEDERLLSEYNLTSRSIKNKNSSVVNSSNVYGSVNASSYNKKVNNMVKKLQDSTSLLNYNNFKSHDFKLNKNMLFSSPVKKKGNTKK